MDIEVGEIVSGNPVIQVMAMKESGFEFEVVDMPKCERKWYYNENGEYVCDG